MLYVSRKFKPKYSLNVLISQWEYIDYEPKVRYLRPNLLKLNVTDREDRLTVHELTADWSYKVKKEQNQLTKRLNELADRFWQLDGENAPQKKLYSLYNNIKLLNKIGTITNEYLLSSVRKSVLII